MPTYIFENPKTGELTEVVQGVHDEHRFIDNALVGYVHRHFFFFSDGPFRAQ